MNTGAERRILLGGAAVSLAAGLGVAAVMIFSPHSPSAPPPASQGGLTVESRSDESGRLDVRKPLRCFVDGRFAGDLPLADCARRNGVSTGSLDVGLDPSGALAASNGGAADITPLPPPANAVAASPPAEGEAPATAAAPEGPTARAILASCWRYESGAWTILPFEMSLPACVGALYQGRCERPGAAAYGRWGERTLRLVPGEVEISSDNRDFRGLAPQGPACSLTSLG